ncbi:hypothetical protein QUF74_19230 [Candidatus Halobeggiatoa sp. HSG11]|nr:hypothetical protein [Candidatus Halobeggiatoa sp. HSG11]
MHQLTTIILAFFDICRLRSGPQDLPTSKIFLVITLIFYTIIGFILPLIQISLTTAILSAIVDTALLVILVGSLLYFASHSARIIQTLTALAGTNALFGIPVISLFLVNRNNFTNEEFVQNISNIDFMLLLLFYAVIMWNFIVYSHILRNSLEIPMVASLTLTILISLLTFTIQNQIVPVIK